MARRKGNLVWVRRTTRRLKKGKSRRVKTGGYWRRKRPKGRKKKLDSKPRRLYTVRDEYGRIIGTSRRR